MKEKNGVSISGWGVLLLLLAGVAYGTYFFIELLQQGPISEEAGALLMPILIAIGAFLAIIILPGFFVNQPNERKVLTFLGHYVGTVKKSGYRWTIPFFKKKRVSVRLYNFETKQLKVNDANGNPIEIGAIIVWRVTDTAKALFDVDDFGHFVNIQSESALRTIAMRFPYESHHELKSSLTSHTEEVAALLEEEIAKRVLVAGIEIKEARISHLAYSREIAHSMLQKQQAHAVVMARQTIIEGAIGLVEMAINQLETKQIVQLTEEKKAALVSNLLVVLCSEGNSQPILDVGTN